MLKELKIKYTKHEIKEELKTKICIKHNRKKELKLQKAITGRLNMVLKAWCTAEI